ncbi:MAG: bacteriohemerythrin [Clostridiales bacterium]|jgi:hemerythrin|nr:bacteriohemerythrin [Clostridiales bacterium]
MLEITKELETGIPIVDAQHRELVAAVNDLINLGEKAKDPEIMRETLDFLAKYCVMHFNVEEDMMNQCVYPACYLHENQHRLFVDKFVEYKERFETEGYSDELVMGLNHFLVNWIINHIKVSDVAFGTYYLEKFQEFKE